MSIVRRWFSLFAIAMLALPFMAGQPTMAAGVTVTPGAPTWTKGAGVRYKGWNTGGEIFLGPMTSGSATPRAEANYNEFQTIGAKTYTITFGFDAPTNVLSTSIANPNVPVTFDLDTQGAPGCPVGDWDAMQIYIKDGRTDSGVALQNVMLGANSLGNFGTVDKAGTPPDQNWTVTGFDFSQSFQVTADLVVDGYTGNEGIKIEINVGCLPPPSAGITTQNTNICVGDTATINVNIANVSNLYGYELKVNYPTTGFTATGTFVNSFFNTAGAAIPPDWNATDNGGTINFAASKVEPGAPVSGSGIVATVTLTATTAGIYDITLSNVLLSDRDANPINALVSSTPVQVTVCGYATVRGTVSLQGRNAPPAGTIPPTSGTVTLPDAGFGPYSTMFDASGAFTITNVKVAPGGTTYTISATHGLYLGNERAETLAPGDDVTLPATRLKGGDANNDSEIDISDLTCIGGAFGGAPVVCGASGSSDINADGLVNILDLVLPGGNYGLTAPQPW